MRAQFCVYACALLLAGAHGCTGRFADNVKLTKLIDYKKDKDIRTADI